MLPSDDPNKSTGSFERNERSFNHREFLNERRRNILQQKQTDHLPSIDNEPLNGRIAWRQLMQLREENKRLRWELAEATKDVEELHESRQQEIEFYQTQLQTSLESRDRLQEEHNELELRYQELYHAFQSAVEEEATKIVDEAARTIELGSEDRPEPVNDIMKTVELRVRQAEDKHTAQALYLMRQTQRKASRLEQELLRDREQIALERQNLHNLQQSAREQAELRKRTVEQRLRARYTLSLTLVSTVLLILLPLMQITLFTLVHLQLTPLIAFLLFAPLIICALLAFLFAHLRASTRMITTSAQPKKGEKAKS
jgi:cation transport ATPase